MLPLGWFVPVPPGAEQVTVGGAVGADLHGPNHHRAAPSPATCSPSNSSPPTARCTSWTGVRRSSTRPPAGSA
ncbi:hypothetical protein ACFQVA_14305 [Actinomadura keratinilytica]